VMGSQIAAHLANAGVPVLLLDVTKTAADAGAAKLLKMNPAPYFVPENAALIRTGSFDDLAPLADVDWIIEAVVEKLDVKQGLLARVDAVRAPHTIVSSNTSGIPLAAIAEGRSAGFRAHWIGTHFFNPPRYLRLVELIATPDTDPAMAAALSAFIERRLGKVVVPAADTPAFIANHLGMFGVIGLLNVLATGKYSIEEIDAITGPAIGRPKSATLRTVDLAGLDIVAHVAADLERRLPPEQGKAVALPAFLPTMIEKGMSGEQPGPGFYKKGKDGAAGLQPGREPGSQPGRTKILTLDLNTFEYREPVKVKIASLDAAKGLDTLEERLRFLLAATDKAGELLRETLTPALEYAKAHAPFANHASTDLAMKHGFGWKPGPFETLAVPRGRAGSTTPPPAKSPPQCTPRQPPLPPGVRVSVPARPLPPPARHAPRSPTPRHVTLAR